MNDSSRGRHTDEQNCHSKHHALWCMMNIHYSQNTEVLFISPTIITATNIFHCNTTYESYQLTAGLDWANCRTWLHFSSRSFSFSLSLKHMKYAYIHWQTEAIQWIQTNLQRNNNMPRCHPAKCSIALCFNSHFPGGPWLASTGISPFWILWELTGWWWQLEL